MARPTKLTPAAEAAILDALRAGCTRTAAFEAAGIARSKVSVYMRRFGTFRDAVHVAEAEVEIRMTGIIDAASSTDWKAALAWLERRRPSDWSKTSQVSVEIRLLAEQIAARTGADPDWLIKRASEIANGAST